jgi:hypothetical protein
MQKKSPCAGSLKLESAALMIPVAGSVIALNADLVKKEFKTLSDCLIHKKQEHPNLVSFCKNETEGTCKFRKGRCWFKHNEQKGIIKPVK